MFDREQRSVTEFVGYDSEAAFCGRSRVCLASLQERPPGEAATPVVVAPVVPKELGQTEKQISFGFKATTLSPIVTGTAIMNPPASHIWVHGRPAASGLASAPGPSLAP